MSLDDFEELIADAPEDERWELISGRVVRMMVGAPWEHNRINQQHRREPRYAVPKRWIAVPHAS